MCWCPTWWPTRGRARSTAARPSGRCRIRPCGYGVDSGSTIDVFSVFDALTATGIGLGFAQHAGQSGEKSLPDRTTAPGVAGGSSVTDNLVSPAQSLPQAVTGASLGFTPLGDSTGSGRRDADPAPAVDSSCPSPLRCVPHVPEPTAGARDNCRDGRVPVGRHLDPGLRDQRGQGHLQRVPTLEPQSPGIDLA